MLTGTTGAQHGPPKSQSDSLPASQEARIEGWKPQADRPARPIGWQAEGSKRRPSEAERACSRPGKSGKPAASQPRPQARLSVKADGCGGIARVVPASPSVRQSSAAAACISLWVRTCVKQNANSPAGPLPLDAGGLITSRFPSGRIRVLLYGLPGVSCWMQRRQSFADGLAVTPLARVPPHPSALTAGLRSRRRLASRFCGPAARPLCRPTLRSFGLPVWKRAGGPVGLRFPARLALFHVELSTSV